MNQHFPEEMLFLISIPRVLRLCLVFGECLHSKTAPLIQVLINTRSFPLLSKKINIGGSIKFLSRRFYTAPSPLKFNLVPSLFVINVKLVFRQYRLMLD